MKEYSNEMRVVFRNRKEDIPLNLNTCLEKIKKRTEGTPIAAPILSRIKWVISEMLSNAVKHSFTEESLFKITINEYQLIIEKEDDGQPLKLTELENGKKMTWPLEEIPDNPNFQIYQNGIDLLIAHATERHQATFFVQQLQETYEPELLINIAEHFGLLIIAKASDEFLYEYDVQSNTNRFISSFKLKVV